MQPASRRLLLLLSICLVAGCARQTAPVFTRTHMSSPDDHRRMAASQLLFAEPVRTLTTHIAGPEQTQRFVVHSADYRIHPLNASPLPKIALLTFDDGPVGQSTKGILDVLDEHSVKSIWFVNGLQLASKHADGGYTIKPDKAALLRDIEKRGHLIGNHTWTHLNLRKISAEQQREEIESTNRVITEITGKTPLYFRPPFGASTQISDQVCRSNGMQSINWSVGSLDWEPAVYKKPHAIAKQVAATIHPGATILFHDRTWTAAELDEVLTGLEAAGYRFVIPTDVESR